MEYIWCVTPVVTAQSFENNWTHREEHWAMVPYQEGSNNETYFYSANRKTLQERHLSEPAKDSPPLKVPMSYKIINIKSVTFENSLQFID